MSLSRWLYYGDFVAIPLVIAALLARELSAVAASSVVGLVSAAGLGVLAWTLLEYLVHRFAYHSWWVLTPLHAAHHDRPPALLEFPSFLSVGMFVLLVFAPLRLVDPALATGLTRGMLMGYLAYAIVHHASHHFAIPPGHLLYPARLRHLAHNRNESGNFGVTTSFWDVAFGTARRRAERDALP